MHKSQTCPSARQVQQPHSYRFLRSSFVPPQHIRTLRTFVRQRRTNLQLASDHIRRAHKAIALGKHLAPTFFYHRIKSRKGSLGAIKATARKIAVIFYNVMTKGFDFAEQGIKLYEQKIKERQLKYLHKQAKRFGFTLSPQLE